MILLRGWAAAVPADSGISVTSARAGLQALSIAAEIRCVGACFVAVSPQNRFPARGESVEAQSRLWRLRDPMLLG